MRGHLERNRYWCWVVVNRALWATSRRRRVILWSVVDDRAVDIGTAQLFKDPGGDLTSVNHLSRVKRGILVGLSIRFNISLISLSRCGMIRLTGCVLLDRFDQRFIERIELPRTRAVSVTGVIGGERVDSIARQRRLEILFDLAHKVECTQPVTDDPVKQ